MDRQKSVGIDLFNDKSIKFQPDLLIGLVQALMLLSEEMGETKGPLREVELGAYQISILSQDHLAYIVVQSAWDSEPFTRRILDSILAKHHEELAAINFNRKIENEDSIRESIAKLLKTMKFPEDIMPDILPYIEEFNANTNLICDALFLADLDDGIVIIWNEPENESITKILMELLSEIDYQRSWLGESILHHPKEITVGEETKYVTSETWFMFRIGQTDFCILGRGYYSPGLEKDLLVKNLETLSDKIFDKLIAAGIEY